MLLFSHWIRRYEMTYQDVLNLALKAYGETLVVYAGSPTLGNYNNMCFWQDEAYAAARDVASHGADVEVQ
jgi:hypothetical protein